MNLLFDVDGVLVATEHLHERATSAAAGCYVDCSGGGSTQDKLARAGFTPKEIPHIYDRKRKFYSEYVKKLERDQKLVWALCEVVKKKHLLAACSNSSRDSCHSVLRNTGVLPLFSTIVTGGDVKNLKPHPEVYLLAMHKLMLSPDKCIVFEDSDEGETAARAAGIPEVVRCTTTSLLQELQKWM
jgi:HAD superfamily hydrolase (TIGR01509 family)